MTQRSGTSICSLICGVQILQKKVNENLSLIRRAKNLSLIYVRYRAFTFYFRRLLIVQTNSCIKCHSLILQSNAMYNNVKVFMKSYFLDLVCLCVFTRFLKLLVYMQAYFSDRQKLSLLNERRFKYSFKKHLIFFCTLGVQSLDLRSLFG